MILESLISHTNNDYKIMVSSILPLKQTINR